MSTRTPTHARSAGHTLLELVVALAVGGLLLTLGMSSAAEVESSSRKLEARARDIAERELIVESLRRDMAGAQSVRLHQRNSLRIVREPARARALGIVPALNDPGVLYTWSDGLLLREDLALDRRHVVARRLSDFQVDDLAGLETQIDLSFGEGEASTTLQLIWERRT
ncbi:MAG: hypothetical protein DHS20C15_29040 [Planctomycetota bacterium]|nr:MAG: hypothetical protein DHS20C15_29040 [Planctomycetota bacterium]